MSFWQKNDTWLPQLDQLVCPLSFLRKAAGRFTGTHDLGPPSREVLQV